MALTAKRQKFFPHPPFSDEAGRTWIAPVGIVPLSEEVIPLAGGPYGFTHLDIFIDDGVELTVTRIEVDDFMNHVVKAGQDSASAIIERLTAPRPDYAGLSMAEPQIMGIINATPDSFSDGGEHLQAEDAIVSGLAMVEQGALILDVGGESSRPESKPVGHDEECRRILPIIKSLSQSGHIVSADTRHTTVMTAALDEGAKIINDISGLQSPDAIEFISKRQVPVVIMHMQGSPETMQNDPHYRFAPLDIYDWLESRIDLCTDAGLPRHLIAIDPGFGFGKTPDHNMQIMAHLGLFHGLGVPIVLGVSRKSTIAHFSKAEAAKQRVPGSVALAAMARAQGVQIFRVHDVAETMQALTNTDALLKRKV